MKKWLVCVSLLGCSGDDGGTTSAPDSATIVDSASVDTASEPDTTPSIDTSITTDAGADTTVPADTTVADAKVTDTGSPPDTTPSTDAAGKKPGQCYTNAHCPSGDCRSNAPGGICGCTPSSGCSSSTFSCGGFAACVLDCTVDTDCITGMRCTTSGCALRPCSNDGDCPSTTVCRALGGGSSKYCQRKLCPDGTGCPTGTTCLTSAEGKSCVEDFLKF